MKKTNEKTNILYLILGKKGYGKTTFCKELIKDIKHPVFIFDVTGEYSNGFGNEIFIYSPAELRSLLMRSQNLNGKRILIMLDEMNFETFSRQCFELLFLYQKQINSKTASVKKCTIVIEEAWNFMTSHKIDPYFKSIALLGRHYGINAIVCSQRIANLNRNFYSQCDFRVTFYQDDPYDLEVLQKYGINAENIKSLPKGKYINF